MRAVRLHGLPNDTRVDDIPSPEMNSNSVLVHLSAATICANDWKMAVKGSRGVDLPTTLGHELAGVVDEVGSNVKGYKPGDRVCIRFAGAIYCGHCFYCLRGLHHLCENWIYYPQPAGWVEKMIFDSRLDERLLPMADQVSFEAGALVEPLACSLAGVEQAQVQYGEEVVILGAGAMGLFCLELSLLAGAARVIVVDTVPGRLKIAQELGAQNVVDFKAGDPVEAVKNLTKGRGAASVIECSGSLAGAAQAVKMARKHGTVVWFAGLPTPADLQLDANLIHYSAINLTGSSGSSIRHSHKILGYLETGRLNYEPIITHHFHFDQAKEALDLAASQSQALKIVLEP